MKKKIFAVMLVLSMVLGLAACGSSSGSTSTVGSGSSKSTSTAQSSAASSSANKSDTKLKVGFTANDLDNDSVQEAIKSLQEECDKNGWEFTPIDYKQDLATCISTIENFITAGCDVIIFQVPDSEGVADVVKRAQDAGIIVGTYDSPDKVGNYYQTQSDEEIGKAIGEMAAAYVNKKFDGNCVAYSVGYPSNPILKTREDSYIKAFEENTKSKVVGSVDVVKFNGDYAAMAETIAQAAPDVQVVLTIADVLCVGMEETFNSLGYTSDKGFAMFGCDAISETRSQWDSGNDTIQGTVWTNLNGALLENFDRCTKEAATGEKSDAEIHQDATSITPDNYKNYFSK